MQNSVLLHLTVITPPPLLSVTWKMEQLTPTHRVNNRRTLIEWKKCVGGDHHALTSGFLHFDIGPKQCNNSAGVFLPRTEGKTAEQP